MSKVQIDRLLSAAAAAAATGRPALECGTNSERKFLIFLCRRSYQYLRYCDNIVELSTAAWLNHSEKFFILSDASEWNYYKMSSGAAIVASPSVPGTSKLPDNCEFVLTSCWTFANVFFFAFSQKKLCFREKSYREFSLKKCPDMYVSTCVFKNWRLSQIFQFYHVMNFLKLI